MKNKSLIFIILLIVIGLLIPGSSSGFNTGSIDSSVTIGIEIENKRVFIGSGVYIESKIGDGILTAKHVAEALSRSNERIIVCNMQKENCSYIKGNYISSSNNELDGDWAFYKGEFNYKKSKIYSKELKIQEEVFAIGNAWGVQSWVSRGNISWIDKEKLVHIQGFCAPGCSGGGVFKGNKVAGIIVAIHFNDFGPETTQLIAIPVSKMSIF